MSQFSEYDDHICRLTRNNINGSAPKKKPKKANDSLKPLKIKQVDKWKPKIKNKYISNSGKKNELEDIGEQEEEKSETTQARLLSMENKKSNTNSEGIKDDRKKKKKKLTKKEK